MLQDARHLWRPHLQLPQKPQRQRIITKLFATTLPPALVTARVSQPFSTMDIEPKLHLTTNVLARPMDLSFNPNIAEHPSNIFTSVGFDLTIVKSPDPPEREITSVQD